MGKYDAMTQEEFGDILADVVFDNARTLLDVPGVYECVSEHFNNEVLDIWESRNAKPVIDEEQEAQNEI